MRLDVSPYFIYGIGPDVIPVLKAANQAAVANRALAERCRRDAEFRCCDFDLLE